MHMGLSVVICSQFVLFTRALLPQFVLFTRALLPIIFVFPEQLTYLYILYPFHLSESRFKQKLIVQPFTKQYYAPYTPLASAFMVSFPALVMEA